MTSVYRNLSATLQSAFAAVLLLGAALPWNAMAVDCTLANGKYFKDTPELACPGGTCAADPQLDNLAQLAAVGCDPPATLRKELGADAQSNTGTTTPSGYCAPGTNGLQGSPTCPIYNVGGNPTPIANNGAGASIFGANGTGNMFPLPTIPGTNVFNPALNQPAQPVAGQTALPAMACGGAVGLVNQLLDLYGTGGNPAWSDVQIGVTPPPLTTTSTNVVYNTIGPGSCAGSTFTLSASEPSLIFPPGVTVPINNGVVNPPAGSVISIPAGTPVIIGILGGGSISLPNGGTILDPNGNTIFLPQNTTLTSLGGGPLQVSIPGVQTTTYTYNLNAAPITQPGVLSINTTEVGLPAGVPLTIDPGSSIISPGAPTGP